MQILKLKTNLIVSCITGEQGWLLRNARYLGGNAKNWIDSFVFLQT